MIFKKYIYYRKVKFIRRKYKYNSGSVCNSCDLKTGHYCQGKNIFYDGSSLRYICFHYTDRLNKFKKKDTMYSYSYIPYGYANKKNV